MEGKSRLIVARIAQSTGITNIPADWTGCDAVWPLLEQMRTDKAVILINVVGLEGQPPFVVNIIGKVMCGDCITTQASTIEEALSLAVIEYAKRFWGWSE